MGTCGRRTRLYGCDQGRYPGEEGGYLGSGDGLVGAVAVVVGWVAALGYSCLGEPVDVLFVGGSVVVAEVVAFRLRQFQCSGEEGGYLGSGDGLVGAVAVVVGWVAALGYSCLGEPVDVLFVGGSVVVAEVVAFRLRQFQCSGEEGGYLGSGDGLVGAVAVVVGWVAALGYSCLGEPVDVLFVGGSVVVAEVVAFRLRQFQCSGEEGGYLGSGDGLVGAVAVVVGWVAALGYSCLGEPVDVLFVGGSLSSLK